MNSGVNLSIIRYADILLMYAEAQFEKGNMDATIWNQTILPLRNRAGFTEEAKAYPTEKTEAEMRQIIRNERRCELALEGLRWYDISNHLLMYGRYGIQRYGSKPGESTL